jgi:EpsI family protein
LADVFGLTFPAPFPPGAQFRERELPKQFWVAGALLLTALGLSLSLEQREEIVPPRAEFAEFPMEIAAWTGRRQIMERQYVDALKFDDYVLADFVRSPHPAPLPGGEGITSAVPVNFYSAYYANQRKGESIHSPRSCIPGGGWQIAAHEVASVDGVSLHGQPMKLNRLVIQKGEDRQLVYYWFQQRGRNLTSEYLVKWFLFQDALTMNRSDGALVRLVTPSFRGEDLAEADRRLQDFLHVLLPALDRHIPH